MAGTDQGEAHLAASFDPTQWPRMYLPGLDYEEGFGNGPSPAGNTQATDNHGYLVRDIFEDVLSDRAGPRTNTDRPTLPARPIGTDQGEARPTSESDAVQGTADWWDKVHILPRTKIDFGNIITQKQDEYELYNSHREDSVTLNSITNNASPGVELPDEGPPEVVPPQASLLDSGKTDNCGPLFQLGTMDKRDIIAEADGLPLFDTTIDFNMSSGQVAQLLVAGTRIVFFPFDYEAPVKETLAFLTDIIAALSGKEQRLALRKNPRQLYEVTYKLTENDRQRMQALLMDWQDNVFGFPVQAEKLTLQAATVATATQYQVTGADDVDLRVGGLAVIVTDANTFDVITISALTDTLITATDGAVNAYPAGTAIYPLRTATMLGAVAGRRHANNLEEFKITFEVTDNDTGALTGSTAAYSTYNGRVLFDDCNVITGPMAEDYRRRIYRIDNATGKVSRSSLWDRGKRTHQKGFVLRNRSEIQAFKQVMLSLGGRQKAFYIPTFAEDVTPKATMSSGGTTMDIERIEYERFVQTRLPKTIMKMTYNTGSGDVDLIRIVQSVASVDTTTERLTLDTTWPENIDPDEVSRVQFYELVRFDSDNVNINYPRIGLAECRMPLIQVFDDN